MSDTKESLQRADKFETEWQHHRDDAPVSYTHLTLPTKA